MTYAQRPMGDYKTYGYAGDPGWLSSIWKAVKKPVMKVVGPLIGGPIGGIITAASVGGAVVAATKKPVGPPAPPPPVQSVAPCLFPAAQLSLPRLSDRHMLASVHTHRPGITSIKKRARSGFATGA